MTTTTAASDPHPDLVRELREVAGELQSLADRLIAVVGGEDEDQDDDDAGGWVAPDGERDPSAD